MSQKMSLTSRVLTFLGRKFIDTPEALFADFLPPDAVPRDYYSEQTDRVIATPGQLRTFETQIVRRGVDFLRQMRAPKVGQLLMWVSLVACAIGYLPAGIKATWNNHETAVAVQVQTDKNAQFAKDEMAKLCASPGVQNEPASLRPTACK
jgi:hypothetical protein